jgi:uncharacterized RDD family membrane protein YckC
VTKRIFPIALAIVALSAGLHAQDTERVIEHSADNASVGIFQNYTVRAGETAHAVVVVGADATIDGHVEQDVVVIAGRAQLTSQAVIDGSLVVIGGTGTIAEGAKVGQDMVVIGVLNAPPVFAPGGSHVTIGGSVLSRLEAVVPWVTHGLLFGRPIVPWLPWVWAVAFVFFLINLLLNVVFDTPVRASTAVMRERPLSAFFTGLLVLLLIGPLCLILAVSVIGIIVIPFLFCALLIATAIGKVGFTRWIGMSVVHQEDLDDRAQSTRSFLIGAAIMCLVYMVPVLGFVTWGLGAVLGLGAATQAARRAYRRENPRPPKKREVAAPAAVEAPAVPPPASAPQPPPATAFVDVEMPPVEPAPFEAPPVAHVAAIPPVAAVGHGGAVASAELLSFPHAPFLQRLAAFGLDLFLLLMLAQVIRLDRVFSDGRSFESNLMLLALLYHVAFWTWRQTTLGGIICQLRLTRVDGGPINFAESLVRALTGIFSLLVVGLGFLWVLRDPERQAWHDRIAGTYVVSVPRGWPI